LDRMRFGRVNRSLWPCGFRREWREASMFAVIMWLVGISISMEKTVAENVMAGGWGLRSSKCGRVFMVMVTLFALSWLVAAASASGAVAVEEYRVLSFRVKL
jgi:hypothetical protein